MSMWSLASTSPKRLVMALNSSMCFRRLVPPLYRPPLLAQRNHRNPEGDDQQSVNEVIPRTAPGRLRPAFQLLHAPDGQAQEQRIDAQVDELVRALRSFLVFFLAPV